MKNKIYEDQKTVYCPRFPSDAFKGTAEHYAEHRPPYPQNLISDLTANLSKSISQSLLDLGCGPGRVTIPLQPYFKTIIAVDPEIEMINECKKRTDIKHQSKTKWICDKAENINLESNSIDLITIGEAFHRMNQLDIAVKSRKWLKSNGRIAILGYKHIWNNPIGWKFHVNKVLDKYKMIVPNTRFEKSKENYYTFNEILSKAGFSNIRDLEYKVKKTWRADDILGYLYSVSVFSKRNLGKYRENFENDILSTLRDYDSKGSFDEEAEFQCLVAESG